MITMRHGPSPPAYHQRPPKVSASSRQCSSPMGLLKIQVATIHNYKSWMAENKLAGHFTLEVRMCVSPIPVSRLRVVFLGIP